ncbi:GNAT family N-acetyltransferase [Pontibacter cellulosilyticus]|uniref:GNAT family N-acetyltransferase n=1 Tax=Pontibacter cellulosilyticus TaxID=1720253 RepID=A0A923N8N8_9BACT|nr:GNAT family N-acetyltransferase [Pontibacter cellulosilyticus]MBC5994251.1 GNAT family N-acetyltransferase [Pontibacter cellulosilyticus]
MLEVVKYSEKYKPEWDAFVAGSKNATFLFFRDYMEYHAQRFTDHSLLFYRKGKLIALLPANEQEREVSSHGGLTYGGVVTDTSMKVEVMLQVFEAMVAYYRQQGYTSIKYKTIPHIYHQSPAEEDLYALLKYGAVLYRRDVLSVIEQVNPLKYSRTRRWEIKKAEECDWQIGLSMDFESFMQMEAQLLKEKYNASPVHTSDEMSQLARQFPDNIKLYTAEKGDVLGAGVIVYETATVAHCQYIGTSVAGRENKALEAMLHHLLTSVYADKKYFDLGASMDAQQPNGLNSTLLANKESYGARAVVHDYYTIPL